MKNNNLHNHALVHLEDLPEVMTIEQMRSFLQIGRNAAYELVRSGQLKSLKIGKSLRIPKTFLLEYINGICYNIPGDYNDATYRVGGNL